MTTSTLTFAQLGLSAPLLRALTEKNYLHPSPIQAEAIPHLLAGRDIMGSAQTGTGKTAAFALPILQRLAATPRAAGSRSPRALILTPTRELAVQIGAFFTAYGKHLPLRHVVIYGGVGQHPQVRGLSNGAEIVIATPGRLLDLAAQGHMRFDRIEVFVLDEADRMLDMGFAPDIKRIVGRLPDERQSLLFSATLPPSIRELAARVVRSPVRIEMTPERATADGISQRVCHVAHGDKYRLLQHILGEHPAGLVLVFMRTKHGAHKLARNLARDSEPAEEIHGNKSQGARQRALEAFRTGQVRVLVATDVAARGIDVKGISLVINYDIPIEPEAYVHRIGRTARAGAEGIAFSFCEPGERSQLRAIQKLLRENIPVHADHPFAPGESSHERPHAHSASHARPHAPAHRPAYAPSHTPSHLRPYSPAPSHAHPSAQPQAYTRAQQPVTAHRYVAQHDDRTDQPHPRRSHPSNRHPFPRQRRGAWRPGGRG
jgi:ATP-dependent RNA helicase RhlE